MRTALLSILICLVATTTAFAATITVAQDGSGAVNSVQIALAAASNGDEIIILDSAVYNEDVAAGAGAGLAAQFTLRAAEGQTPTIRATNTSARLAALGLPGEDLIGTLLTGCVGTTIEGIIFENSTTGVNVLNTSSVLGMLDCFDMTLRNCTFRGAGGPGTVYGGDNVGIIASGAFQAPTGILIEDCVIEDCHYGIGLSILMAGLPTDPSVTIRGCTIRNCNANGIEIESAAVPDSPNPAMASGPGHVIEDSTITNCNSPVTFGGGKTVVRNCTFLGNRSHVNIDKQAKGELPLTAELDDVAVVGSTGTGVRVVLGTLSMTRCIVAGCSQEALHVQGNAEEAVVAVDRSDFYRNLQENPNSYEVRFDPITQLARTLLMSNCNVVGISGIYNGDINDSSVFDPDALTASYCNVFTEFDPFTNVTVDNELQFDPLYASPSSDPSTFTREGFQLQASSPALTAADDGGYLGSQGPVQVGVSDWMVR